jgi:hypothetical protein
MSTEPTLALHDAIIARLKADAAVSELVAGRVYDSAPAKPTFPYVKLDAQRVANLAECIDGSEIFTTLHVFTDPVGTVEAKRIVGAITDSLHDAEFEIEDNTLKLLEFRDVNYLTEPDGLRTHAVLTMRSLTVPA